MKALGVSRHMWCAISCPSSAILLARPGNSAAREPIGSRLSVTS